MLPVTETLVEENAARLAGEGWKYTPRQLYYAVCAATETPPPSARSAASGVLGLGVLAVLLGLIFISRRTTFLILAGLGVVLIAAGLIIRLRGTPRQHGRLLPLSYADFMRRFCGSPREGMLDLVAWRPPAWTLAGAEPAIVCDSIETAAVIGANAEHAGVSAAVLDLAALADGAQSQSVVALHDASPSGCSLLHQLRERGYARVIDAGLRPREIMARNLQVIEGAPAQVPDELSEHLAESEVAWLRSGRRVELAVLSPAEALELVKAALEGSAEVALVSVTGAD